MYLFDLILLKCTYTFNFSHKQAKELVGLLVLISEAMMGWIVGVYNFFFTWIKREKVKKELFCMNLLDETTNDP